MLSFPYWAPREQDRKKCISRFVLVFRVLSFNNDKHLSSTEKAFPSFGMVLEKIKENFSFNVSFLMVRKKEKFLSHIL